MVLDAAKTEAPIGLDIIERDEANRRRYRALLGPLWRWLEDNRTTSVRINGDGGIFVTQFGVGKFRLEEEMPAAKRAALSGYLANLEYGRAMDRLHSRLQCDLPIFGSRVQAFAPPISEWTTIIRNHLRHVLPFEQHMEAAAPDEVRDDSWYGVPDRVRKGWSDAIEEAIRLHKNIPVAGSVDSGKTTLVNSLVAKHADIYPDERLIVVQDRREIVPYAFKDHLVLMARVEQARSGLNGAVSRYMYEFVDCVEDTLRSDGDTAVWGEVRDAHSAVGLARIANTGTRGIKMTIHANSAQDVPLALEDFFLLAGRTPVKRQIAKLCELIIFMQRGDDGARRIIDVQRILGVENDEYVFERVEP